jgi:putative acetyltransferase
MDVRPYHAADTPVLTRLFTETVHAINAADYSPEQVIAWAPKIADIDAWHREFGKLICFVAELNAEVIGFISFEPNGHLEHLYVHSRFQKQGAALALYRRLEEEAISLGIRRIFTEASVTARAFFERVGFRVLSSQVVECRGVSFTNYRMEKLL